MDVSDKLMDIIRRLESGEEGEEIKEEAREFLATVDPKDLTFAEEKLVEAGLSPEDFRHLCSVHMEMLSGEAEKLKARLKPGHVLHTLVSEHEMILSFLDELEKVNATVQTMTACDSEREEFHKLHHIAEHLLEAEAHHQREEEVLFPEVERRGVVGPPQVMRMEHQELRGRKHELKELAENAGKMDFALFKKRLAVVTKFILTTLRDHIFKENNILYPMALQAIREDKKWREMKAKCDEIGYCSFTPSC